ncbi:hypothetical protein J1TS3_00150 [Siminovitchia fordii]|uniref:Uncharacterized protein n=1 Tax=Siminovitchia fordii TaxID=254759 RepID=A0ABQ4JZP5_9BACI|nr:hypothetical protein J1TS3_00150 [Siminovitchia fordii]
MYKGDHPKPQAVKIHGTLSCRHILVQIISPLQLDIVSNISKVERKDFPLKFNLLILEKIKELILDKQRSK